MCIQTEESKNPNFTGIEVTHSTFGKGIISSCNIIRTRGTFTVDFNDCSKKFAYPDSINTFLTTEDPALLYSAEEAKEANKPAPPPVKTPAPKHGPSDYGRSTSEKTRHKRTLPYAYLCQMYPHHLVIKRSGFFYSAFNEAAEIISDALGYNLGYLSQRTPITGCPDILVFTEKLRAQNLSYVVFEDDVLVDRFDGLDPFI